MRIYKFMNFSDYAQKRDQELNESLLDYLAIKNDNPWWYALPAAVYLGGLGLYGIGKGIGAAAQWGYDKVTGKAAQEAEDDRKFEDKRQWWKKLEDAVSKEGVYSNNVKAIAQEFVKRHPDADVKGYVDKESKKQVATKQTNAKLEKAKQLRNAKLEKAKQLLLPAIQQNTLTSSYRRRRQNNDWKLFRDIEQKHPDIADELSAWMQKWLS